MGPESHTPEYSYQENNPYLHEPDPYQEGLRLLKEGRLKEAIRAFEAATQKTPDNAVSCAQHDQCDSCRESRGKINVPLLCFVSCLSCDDDVGRVEVSWTSSG